MPKLPVISGQEAMRAFERGGWRFARQTGSHHIYVKAGVDALLSIPDHRKLDRGTLRRLIRDADLTVEGFIDLLR